MERFGVKTTAELIEKYKIIDEIINPSELTPYQKKHERDISEVDLRIFSNNKYYFLGLKSILQNSEIIYDELSDCTKFKHKDRWMYNIIVLSGVSSDVVYQTLLYLRSISNRLKHPMLIILDELTPIFDKLIIGTNSFVVIGKTNIIKLKSELFYWINSVTSECNAPLISEYILTYSEQDTLLQYLRFHDMKKVALELGVSLRTAYANRASALNKLGSRNIQEFMMQREN